MPSGRMPDVYANGRWHAADSLDAWARAWRAAIVEAVGGRPRVVAAALPPTPAGVALFAALSSLEQPAVLLSPVAADWPDAALPPDTPLVLLPSLAPLASAAIARGAVPLVLPERPRPSGAPEVAPFSGPGIVTFTSGSTGQPKAVFRSSIGLTSGARARLAALGLEPGGGVIVGVTLVHGQGLNMVIAAMLLEGPLGFLPPLNHRAALAMLAMPEFRCWRATPHFADLLGRCALNGPAAAPPVCLLSSPISRTVFDRFLDRFGVPLRQAYASSETGPISVDHRPAADVRPGSVGRPIAGVDVRVGQIDAPVAPGETGRLHVRSPYLMVGYGFPPDVTRPGMVDGWWPTRDLGHFTPDGQLVLDGRIDDCIRTRDGRLVNLAAVADILRELRGIRHLAVVPLVADAGASFGAVIECESPEVSAAALHGEMTSALPPWARPRRIVVVPALPRLANGKPDRQACLAALGGAS